MANKLSGSTLDIVCLYLYHHYKYSKTDDPPELAFPPEMALDVLMAAHYLMSKLFFRPSGSPQLFPKSSSILGSAMNRGGPECPCSCRIIGSVFLLTTRLFFLSLNVNSLMTSVTPMVSSSLKAVDMSLGRGATSQALLYQLLCHPDRIHVKNAPGIQFKLSTSNMRKISGAKTLFTSNAR